MNDDYENPDDDDQEEEDADDEDEQDEEEAEEDDDDDNWQQIWTLNRHGPTWRCDVRSRRKTVLAIDEQVSELLADMKLDVKVTGEESQLVLTEQLEE
ncbi:MAG: hypothetical protein IH899_02205 [Planctomycetes bacterium]|nr:hypothetical protein [Planctomycetota bacterium]